MQLGERDGHAAGLAVKGQTTPAKLHPDDLIRKLAASRVMISFFNDIDVTSNDPRVAEWLRETPKRHLGANAAREGSSCGGNEGCNSSDENAG
jgi:hypothetical protein